jgi:hypothetical protein
VARILPVPTAKAGQVVPLTWVTTNQGNALAQGAWSERVFLVSSNGVNTNQLIFAVDFTNSISVGDSVGRTQQVTIPPDIRAGHTWFAVEIDATRELAERVETNNLLRASQATLISPGLTINLPVTNISEAASVRTVSALVNRNGNLSVPLTVSIASSDTTEVTAPATVTFRAGDASVPLTLTVQRDGIPDDTTEVTITAAAEGYDSGTARLTVENADTPTLSLRTAVSTLNEGESTDLIVSHDGQFVVPITVNLSASGNGELFPRVRTV